MHTSAEIAQAVKKRTLGGVSPWFGVRPLCWVCFGKALSGGKLAVENHWGRYHSTCNSCNLSEQVGVASKAKEY